MATQTLTHMRSGLPVAMAACVAVFGCRPAPPTPAPAGVAELQLPRDARTLVRIAAEENTTGSLTKRREVLDDVARQLAMAAPPDALVPELFDLLAAMAPRVEARAISPAWASYVYTSYQRDLVKDRPTGVPRRTEGEVARALDGYVEFFRLRAR
jgi:hypothetical protein